MLCALGGVVFAAAAAGNRRDIAAFACGLLAAALLVGPGRLPEPSWVGALAAGGAAGYLVRPGYGIVLAAGGGMLGGLSAALAESRGVPAAAAFPVVIVLMVTRVWLARTRPGFASDVVRDEALIAVILLGLVVAVMPGVLEGWQAASNLTVASTGAGDSTSIPMWTLTLVGTALALGAMYSLWSRR